MLKTDAEVPQEPPFTLSNLAPGRSQQRLALAVALVLVAAALLIAGPLSAVRVPRVDAFVPAYGTALFVNDTLTAILLYAQYSILRSRAIVVIASGYLFSALVLIPWFLTFPDAFGPGHLIGGLQSTSWLYFFQHAGFPMFVIAYALTKDAEATERASRRPIGVVVARSIALTFALVAAGALFFTVEEAHLPRVVLDSVRLSPRWPYAAAPVALVSIAAIVMLWRRRRSVLDLWLMVVMLLYSIEIPLSYYPHPVRFSTGWYAVRVLGFISSSVVLVVLLYEISTLYARLLRAMVGQRREREARLLTGDAVAASIAHEMRQPLTAMVTTADAGLRFLGGSVPNLERAKEAFERIVADGHRAGDLVGIIRANFKSDAGSRTSFDLDGLIEETLSLAGGELQKHRVVVEARPDTRHLAVHGDRMQLGQVLLNLVMNAIDSMADNDGARVLSVKTGAGAAGHVTVSVADNGTGISPLGAERMFNPLFSTKADGMGMGLSICRAIIEAHDSRLWFTPNVPRGAMFQFTLPVARAASAGAP